MTKADLINSIAEKAGTTKVDAEKVLKATTDVIMDSVAEGDKVTIHGFGSFECAERSERHTRNPRTGEPGTGSKSAKVHSFLCFQGACERRSGGVGPGQAALVGSAAGHRRSRKLGMEGGIFLPPFLWRVREHTENAQKNQGDASYFD